MKPNESFVGQPVRSLQTMLRVISEYQNAIPTVIPDGIYGRTTMEAVTEFQKLYGLPVTGITNEATWNAIVAAYEEGLVFIGKAQPIEIVLDPLVVFRLNDESPWIYLAQSMLTYLSVQHTTIPTPNHSGKLDTPTEAALKGFQVLAGLTPTGQLDRQTWRYLAHHFTLNANLQQGTWDDEINM